MKFKRDKSTLNNKMDIKEIPKETQTLISASVYINNFTRAIEELVYNSLDAECTSIAIRVSIQESFIQILDNGIGIKKENFCMLGQKYATSKHIDLTTLKSAPDKYGFRGLSLSNIIEISQNVLITSRFHESEETWLKTFCNGTKKEMSVAPARPSKGTTVEIRGFLYNLNIQRKLIDNVHELQNIKSSLEQLSLIHCNVSLSLRDDYKNEIIFKLHKKRDIYQTLLSLFGIHREDVQELQVEKNQYKVRAFISKCNTLKLNQWIYLNGKFVSKTEIHKKVNKVLNKMLFRHNKITKIKNKNNDDYTKSDLPFYFIFISCPFYDFDMTYKNKQTIVEFKDWTEINKLIEKLIQFYCGGSYIKKTIQENKTKFKNTKIQTKPIIDKILNNNVKESRISSIQHGIRGKNIKRNNKKKCEQIDKGITTQNPKNNFKDLNKKKELQNILLNFKKKNDTKKQSKKPSLKDNNKKHYKNHSLSKKIKKIEKLDCLIDKFKNPTDSVRKRCEELSSEAQNINVMPKNKILKFTNTKEYNETISYSNKRVALDTYSVNTKIKYSDNCNNNVDFIKPKTSLDLIQPFTQNYSGWLSFTEPEHTPIQHTHSSPRNNFDYYESLHPKNTFDSHNYQIYSEEKKNAVKHFISTNSSHNFYLRNNFTYTCENLYSVKKKKNLLNDRYKRNNYILKRVCFTMNKNKSDHKEANNSYLHRYDFDNHLDKINNISNTSDKQSHIKLDFDRHKCSQENFQNETYAVYFSNNINEYSSIKLKSIETEPHLKEDIEHIQISSKSKSHSPSNIQNSISETIYPLNYCETIFNSDIAKDVINNVISNGEDNVSFDYEILDDENDKIFEESLLQNMNTKDKKCKLKDMNLTELNILTQNNFAHDMNAFQLKKRHEFMPKGMSQFYKSRQRKNNDISISKIDYYENTVYNNFADNVLVNAEIFSPKLENVKIKSKKIKNTNHRDDSNLIFNASSLGEAKVVFGQIDRKFIATKIKGISCDSSLEYLVLFDQHAVDERIRLETNLSDYFDGNIWRSVELDSVLLKLDEHDLLYLYNHKQKFFQFGLEWTFLDDKILINSIPKAILGKNPRQEDIVLKAIKSLISEEIDVIKTLGGNVTLYPKTIMDLVFSEACRYAIKFGDKLSKSECISMLKMLSTCKTPFQCAHGRPVMAVLIDLPRNIRNYEANFENIKQFKVRRFM